MAMSQLMQCSGNSTSVPFLLTLKLVMEKVLVLLTNSDTHTSHTDTHAHTYTRTHYSSLSLLSMT